MREKGMYERSRTVEAGPVEQPFDDGVAQRQAPQYWQYCTSSMVIETHSAGCQSQR